MSEQIESSKQELDSKNSQQSQDVYSNIFTENEEIPKNTTDKVENVETACEMQNVNDIESERKIIKTSETSIETDNISPAIESTNNLNAQKRKLEVEIEDTTEIKRTSNGSLEDKKIVHLRKNIRDVMDEKQLDSNTLVAQREESERLARVAEQQKVIREYQRQTAVNRQYVRTQNRVLSLLQSGNSVAKALNKTDNRSSSKDISNLRNIAYESKLGIKHVGSMKKTFPSLYTSPRNDIKAKPFLSAIIKDSPIKNEVVTIDSSSDDDCIVLSDDEEIVEDEVEDDPTNSGLHVKDAYNVPDEHGRVVVNIGHPEGEEDIFVAPQIAKKIKPHQIGGVRFLFDNIIESTKRFKSSSGFGCILAHSMGLGKTLQVICFCDLFLRHTSSKTVLCVMPINTIQNWQSEFNTWTPKTSDNVDDIRPRNFDVFVLNDQQKTLTARSKVILKWAEEGGVLLIGYELFRLLALKLIPTRKRRGKNVKTENLRSEANMRLMESVHQALVKPGPDLVICDEGHRIKNAHAGISLALKQIRTRRRIVLTGYPLQNNLLEYWCMVDFVRPNYLGSRTEFCNMFERPIQNGQCVDSTPEDIKLMRYRAHVLHSLLLGFVQRRSHVVLQQTLPQKLEYVILTKMTSFQRQLYDTFMNDVVRKKAIPNPLKAFAVCCKIWNHPDVLYNFLKKRETDLDLDIDDAEGISEVAQPPNSNLAEFDKSNTDSTSSNVNKEQEPKLDIKTEKAENIVDSMATVQINANHNSFNASSESNESTFDKSFYSMYNNMPYSTSCNDNSYWQDSNVPCFIYQPTPSNVYSSNFNNINREQRNENMLKDPETITSSSEICDLDTNEIKTMKTNMMKFNNNSFKQNIKAQDTLLPKIKEVELNNAPNATDASAQEKKDYVSVDAKKNIPDDESEKELQKSKNDESIPYEWAIELMKKYEAGLLENSPKMEIVFFILKESIQMGDRILLFSQSLLTLNLLETFLHVNRIPDSDAYWARNVSYFRLDGSTSSQEREKLVNEFNSNPNVKLFLISTKAGSLGINLVGANRVIVFDASWNPCHDTQAVYRIYRYGQKKLCYVYRIVMDKCLEKKIYDRQIKKQGMSDRVVDECNPDAHLSMKDVTNLCYDYDDEDKDKTDLNTEEALEPFLDDIMQKVVDNFKYHLSKIPFYHESLLIDRKEKKLSQAEKRQAHRGYEMEKKASTKQNISFGTNMKYHIGTHNGTIISRPVASIRPMQASKTPTVRKSTGIRTTRWIPAEVWQRQGMTAQEMTLPLDVVIPTNSSDKSNIILKAGQRVMVLKSIKGIYMQLDSGKIIAIRTSNKASDVKKLDKDEVIDITSEGDVTESSNTLSTSKSEQSTSMSVQSSKDDFKNNSDVYEEKMKPVDLKNEKEFQNKNSECVNNFSGKAECNIAKKINREGNAPSSLNSTKYTTLNQTTEDSISNNDNAYAFNALSNNERSKQNDSCYKNYCHNEFKESYQSPPISSKNDCTQNIDQHSKPLIDKELKSSTDFTASTRNDMPFFQFKKGVPNTTKPNSSFSSSIPTPHHPMDNIIKDNQHNTQIFSQTVMDSNTNVSKTEEEDESHYTSQYQMKKSSMQQHNATENMELNQILPYSVNPQEQQNNSKVQVYVPPYNQYNNSTIPHPITTQHLSMDNQSTNNIYHTNQNLNYHQYYENMYENSNVPTSCDYASQFVDNPTYNPYNSAQYQPNFHANSYTNTAPNPYHPHHWSSLVPPSTHNIQRSTMYPSTYSQFGSPDQWHH